MQSIENLILVVLLCGAYTSCKSDNIDDLNEEFEAISHYSLVVTSSLRGDHEFIIAGTETLWRAGIGHMEIGPEEPFICNTPIASLWMDIDPLFGDSEEGEIDTSLVTNWKFYSIQDICAQPEYQEANWYEFVKIDKAFESLDYGRDKFGLRYIKGDLRLVFVRTLINQADVPEIIRVSADFIAIDR